ncbi:MAG: M48 family metallopeptidase [Burkholderiaceae bacterium]
MRERIAPEPHESASTLAAEYFDGQSARTHAVELSWSGPTLHILGEAIALDIAAADIRWSERTRHGPRVAHLAGGGALHCRDAPACDAWLRAAGHADSPVVHAQQSWPWVLASVAGLALLLTAMALWGVPWLSRAAVLAVPHSVDKGLGEATLATLDRHITQRSALDAVQQQRVREAFAMVVAAQPAGSVPAHELVFRRARDGNGIGANAFALPGGTVVMTDALVVLFEADPAVLSGVLAHELGHVQHRHGLRMVVQASLIGLLSSVVLGDFSSLLAAAPVVLGQASYSRDAEREADAFCAAFLKASGVSPAVMIELFERLSAARANRSTSQDAKDSGDANQAGRARGRATADAAAAWLGIAIASHPADSERIEFFRRAAAEAGHEGS